MADPRLDIHAAPRPIPPEASLHTPLVALVWRAVQRWSEEIAQLRSAAQSAVERERAAWLSLADEYYQLRMTHERLGQAQQPQGASPPGARALALAVRRLEQALREQQIEVRAPVGAAYSAELVELFENVASIEQAALAEPAIHEILLPAIVQGGEVIRLGKAVIALPEQA